MRRRAGQGQADVDVVEVMGARAGFPSFLLLPCRFSFCLYDSDMADWTRLVEEGRLWCGAEGLLRGRGSDGGVVGFGFTAVRRMGSRLRCCASR